MSKFTNIFTKHPQEFGLTYFQHSLFAWGIVSKLLKGAMACAIHSVFPFIFSKTASSIIKELYDKVEDRKEDPLLIK